MVNHFSISSRFGDPTAYSVNFYFIGIYISKLPKGDTESVMCDVIKMRLKRKDERRSGKGNPINRWI